MNTLTCYQDHILTENIWFVWYKTSYCGDERRCHYAGQTNNEQLKIELLSQWKLGAESRNFTHSPNPFFSSPLWNWPFLQDPGPSGYFQSCPNGCMTKALQTKSFRGIEWFYMLTEKKTFLKEQYGKKNIFVTILHLFLSCGLWKWPQVTVLNYYYTC